MPFFGLSFRIPHQWWVFVYDLCLSLLLCQMIIPPNSNKITLASEYSWCKVWELGCAVHLVCRPLKSCFLMCVIIGTVRCNVNFRNCIINVKAEVMCLELNSYTSCKYFVFYRAVLVDAACSWWSVGSYCRHVCWDNTLHCASFTRGEEHEGEVAYKRETKAIAQYSIWGHGDTSGKARHRGFRSATAPQPYWSSWIGSEFKCRNMSSDSFTIRGMWTSTSFPWSDGILWEMKVQTLYEKSHMVPDAIINTVN